MFHSINNVWKTLRGCSLKKKSSYTPPPPKKKKIRKIRKKSKDFFWGYRISIPYLGVNNPSISVFKSFFIHKILVHPKNPDKNPKQSKKIRKNPKKKQKNPKNPKQSKKIRKIQKKRKKKQKNPKKSEKSKKLQKSLTDRTSLKLRRILRHLIGYWTRWSICALFCFVWRPPERDRSNRETRATVWMTGRLIYLAPRAN